jgi:type IV pilus assembly protein PilA
MSLAYYRVSGVSLRRVSKGFTLVELMVTVAIVAVLASVAMPGYSSYTTRSRVMEGLSLAAPAQQSVLEVTSFGSSAGLPQGYATAWQAPAATSNVTAITLDTKTGAIQITYTPTAGGGTLYLNPYLASAAGVSPLPDATQPFTLPSDGVVLWQCAAAGANIVPNSGGLQGTTLAQNAPANCR